MDGDVTTLLQPGGFFGTYRIAKLLGKGGMAEVYLVEDPATNAYFAVKVLDPAVSGKDAEFMQRFVREAEFAMTVRHPNIVAVYDGGIDPETGLCYLTMEYLPGGTLRALLDEGDAISFSGATTIATDIARALVLVESNGMVHRDVKPDNILFAADGTAKLTDLGISRFRGQDVHVTRAEAVVGTPAYMAPEQMLDAHAVDIRSDIYSLGIVMYEMLAGRRPNEGENAMRTLAKAIEGHAFPDVRMFRPDTPEPLATLVSEMTLPDAAERPSSARKVLELLSHPERIVRPADAPAASVPWYRDRSIVYALTAMILAFEALAVALVNAFLRR